MFQEPGPKEKGNTIHAALPRKVKKQVIVLITFAGTGPLLPPSVL